VLRTIAAISHGIPALWNVVVFANSEIPAGINARDRIWPEMAHDGAVELDIPSLSLEDVEYWIKDARQRQASIDEVQAALDATGGCPLYLSDWISGFADNAIRAKILGKTQEYYKQRIGKLDKDARHLLCTLSLLPDGERFDLSLCAKLIGNKTALEANDVLLTLAAARFVAVADAAQGVYRFIHDITQRSIRDGLSIQVKRDAARRLLSNIDRIYIDNAQRSLRTVMLLDYAGDEDSLSKEVKEMIPALMARGAYEAALHVFKISERHQSCVTDKSIGAEILWHLGYYNEALDQIGRVPPMSISSQNEASAALLRGKILLRLNKYSDALAHFQTAKDFFSNNNDVSGIVSTLNEVNTIMRDVGCYDEAIKQSEDNISLALNSGAVDKRLLAQTHEACARSLAFSSRWNEGVLHAKEALRISETENLIKVKGNAYLSMAECFRHGNNNAAAIEQYERAIVIAQFISNRDSRIWSVLGLSDCYFMEEQYDRARSELKYVEQVVNNADDRYPLEYLHWKLSVATIDYVEHKIDDAALHSAALLYEKLKIKWPQDYCAKLAIHQTTPKRM
jgi:tetratricopeptide (TPR) repeat protein